jgi:hypothetical protein
MSNVFDDLEGLLFEAVYEDAERTLMVVGGMHMSLIKKLLKERGMEKDFDKEIKLFDRTYNRDITIHAEKGKGND